MKPLFDHLPTEERFRRILSHGPAVIYTAESVDSRSPGYVSPNVVDVLGFPPEGLFERPGQWLERIHPDDWEEVRASAERLRRDGKATRLYRFRDADEQYRWIQDQQTLVPALGGGEEVLGFLLDVTERKRLEEQLRQAQKMEAVGRLAGGIAHDFNNLLTAITGYSELLLQTIDDPGVREDLEEIHRAGDRAASLTRQLLAFSRSQVLQPKVLDLNGIVLDLEKMLKRILGEDVALTTDLEANLARIRIDPGQLEQVIMNLAVNSRDAMPGGGKLTLETRNLHLAEEMETRHAVVPPGSYVVLTVSDSGIGMDQGTQDRIFEPFFTTKRKGKGTGLGLATVYGIVKQSGGFVFVYSESGTGTTFRIYLPQCQADAEGSGAREQVPSGSGTETIVVAEDDTAVRSLIVRALSAQGYRVEEAATGQEAIAACRRLGPRVDLVLSDYVMPDLRGPEVESAVRVFLPGVPFLYMSGYREFGEEETGDEPSRETVAKPFSPSEIARRVRAAIDRAAVRGAEKE